MTLDKQEKYEILTKSIINYIKDELINVIDAKLVEKDTNSNESNLILVQMYLDERINRVYIKLEIDALTRHIRDPKYVYTKICSRIINNFPFDHDLQAIIIGESQSAILNKTLVGIKESNKISINTVAIWQDYFGTYQFIDNDSYGLILRGDIGVNAESPENMSKFLQYVSGIKEINEKYDYVNNNATDSLAAFEELKTLCFDLYGKNLIVFEESEIKRIYIEVMHN